LTIRFFATKVARNCLAQIVWLAVKRLI